MRGSRLLSLLGVAVFAAFWLQRARSPFLQIEAETSLSVRVAVASGLAVPEVMALRESCGVDLTEDELLIRARALASARMTLGDDDLAVLATIGPPELATSLLAASGGDPGRAAVALRSLPEAVVVTRFRAMVERFSSRRDD